MNFQLKSSDLTSLMTGLCVACALMTGGLVVSGNLQKKAQTQQLQLAEQELQQSRELRTRDRAFALTQLAKEYRIKNCWSMKADSPLTVDLVIPPLSTGKIPSTCITTKNQTQYAYLAEYDGALRVRYVFTPVELSNELSKN